jgi:hypothetical protein
MGWAKLWAIFFTTSGHPGRKVMRLPIAALIKTFTLVINYLNVNICQRCVKVLNNSVSKTVFKHIDGVTRLGDI